MATDLTRSALGALAILFAVVCALSVLAEDRYNDDAVTALARDPEKLQQSLRECRLRVAPADDPSCRAASLAWRRRFLGTPTTDGDVKRRSPTQASQWSMVESANGDPVAPLPWVFGP